jgi:hypothetical protein
MEEVGGRIELKGTLDRQSAEALQLELRRLARRHGITIKSARVESAAPGQEARDDR